MLRLASFVLCFFVILVLQGSLADSRDNRSVCLLEDAPVQCGAFCLAALRPLFDRIPVALEKLDRMETKLLEVETKLASYQSAVRNSSNIIPLEIFEERLSRMEDRFQAMRTIMDSHQNTLQDTLTRIYFKIPPDFERIGSRYFYIERNIQKTWAEAADSCRQKGGYLAAIKDEVEHLLIAAKLLVHRCYWLGINDINKEGEFVSLASGKKAPFVKWATGRPYKGSTERDYVQFLNGYIYDRFSYEKCFYICQSDNTI